MKPLGVIAVLTPFGHVACIPLLVRPDPYGEMFQTSTNRQ